MRSFEFKLRINHEGKKVEEKEIERILRAFFQCVQVKAIQQAKG